jgi:hypothetical protein
VKLLAVLAILLIASCSAPTPGPHCPPPPDSIAWPGVKAVQDAPHLYTMVVEAQLIGRLTVDSVMSWSTAGGALRIERKGKPGPLVVQGEYVIVSLEERF